MCITATLAHKVLWHAGEPVGVASTGGSAAKMGSAKALANPQPDGLGLTLMANGNVRAPHHVSDTPNMCLDYF